MRVHDLNFRAHLSLGRGVLFLPGWPRRPCVRWAVRVYAVDELSAATRVQRVRRQVSRRSSQSRLLLPRPFLGLGIRAAHLSRKLAGRRNLLASLGAQAVPRWISRQGLAEHLGRRQSRSRLANLRRLRPSPDSAPAANATSTARAALVARSTRRRGSAAIRRLSWRAPSLPGCTPTRSAASCSTTSSNSDGWCS